MGVGSITSNMFIFEHWASGAACSHVLLCTVFERLEPAACAMQPHGLCPFVGPLCAAAPEVVSAQGQDKELAAEAQDFFRHLVWLMFLLRVAR